MKVDVSVLKSQALIAILGTVFWLAPLSGSAQSAIEIMEKNFVITKVTDSESEATFILRNKSGKERVRKTFGTTKLKENGIDNM